MNLLSEIISKPVLNLYNGRIEGTIKNVCFDNSFKKILHLKMFDNEEEEFLIDTTKIYCVGQNSIVIKNSEALTSTINENICQENNPINLASYSILGNSMGKLTDIELNDKFEAITFITEIGTKIKREQILNIGQSIIINDTDKKITVSNFKPKIKLTNVINEKNIITIMPKIEDNSKEQNLNIIEPTEKKIEKKEPFKIYNQPTPQKLIGNGNFLIGRKAVKTIYGINNEIIIKKDNIINAKNLENAKKHSKLVELTVFSKIKA